MDINPLLIKLSVPMMVSMLVQALYLSLIHIYVLFYQLAHRLGVACGQRTLGFAQNTVMDDHVPEQINE